MATVALQSNKYLPLQDMTSFCYPANVEVIKSDPRSKAELSKNQNESGVFCGFGRIQKGAMVKKEQPKRTGHLQAKLKMWNKLIRPGKEQLSSELAIREL